MLTHVGCISVASDTDLNAYRRVVIDGNNKLLLAAATDTEDGTVDQEFVAANGGKCPVLPRSMGTVRKMVADGAIGFNHWVVPAADGKVTSGGAFAAGTPAPAGALGKARTAATADLDILEVLTIT